MMCDPGTALLIGGGMAMAGSVVGGLSGRAQAKYQSALAQQSGQYASAMAEENALFYESVGEYNAKAAIEQARIEEGLYRDQAQRQISTIRVKQAQGGQLSGSAMDVLADQAMTAERNAQIIKYRGAVQAQQELFSAEILARKERQGALEAQYSAQAQSTAYGAQGRSSLLGGFFGAGSSLLQMGAMMS